MELLEQTKTNAKSKQVYYFIKTFKKNHTIIKKYKNFKASAKAQKRLYFKLFYYSSIFYNTIYRNV